MDSESIFRHLLQKPWNRMEFKRTICVWCESMAMDLITAVTKSRCLCNNVCCLKYTRDHCHLRTQTRQHTLAFSFRTPFSANLHSSRLQVVSDEPFFPFRFRQRECYINKTEFNVTQKILTLTEMENK